MASVIVAGLGISGLGCALELAKSGVEFAAFEKELRPGGLARSEQAGAAASSQFPDLDLITRGSGVMQDDG